MRRLFAALSTVLISVLVFSPVVQAGGFLADPSDDEVETTDAESKLLQFTSQGHVLGFRDDGVVIASARHMLKVNFLGSKGVAPKTDGDVESDEAQPLGRVTYQNVWDGVSVAYEANKSSVVKSTYYVDDGSHTNRIRLGYNRPVQLDGQGNLVISFEDGTLTESAPIAWQEIKGQRKPVKVSYALHGDHEVGFSLGEYVPGIPVVIDPDLTWNTFLGGAGNDTSFSIAVDVSGNVYVGGESNATWGSPIRAYTLGNDAFAAKLDNNGNLIWHTFLGGVGNESGNGITIDDSGNIYLAGYSSATWGTPVRAYTSGVDGSVTKLDTNGNLIWNTFLGGTGTSEIVYDIALDGSGNVYVGGYSSVTWGTPIRAYTAGQDAFAAKLDNSGALIWNTFLGGAGTDRIELHGLAIDGSGNTYIGILSAATWGTPIRAYTAGNDGAIIKLDTNGGLIWSTFFGGSGTDSIYGISVDGSGYIYAVGNCGATWGTPVQSHVSGTDGCVAKFDNDGGLIWNTFFGSAGTDGARGVTTDSNGNVYIVGYSPATWGTPTRAYSLGIDAFVAKLDNNGALIWNTFLGGSGIDYGYDIGLDNDANIYIGSNVSTVSWGTPIRPFTVANDFFVAKLAADSTTPSYGGGTAHPIIHLTKEATPASLPDGKASVTYTYIMTNPGNVTLTDITLVDDKCSNVIYISGDTDGNSLLETSETWTYTCTVILTKTTINFATAQGFGAGLVTSDTAIAEVFVGNTPAPPATSPTSTEPTPPPVLYRDLRHALVKLPDDGDANTQTDSAVYYIGSDGQRHAFPNDKVYFSWYSNFNGIQIMDESQLASIPLGKNVTYKPGVKMVKFTTNSKVYAVSRNGVLRWITSESIATSLYGSNWTQRIDDISDAFFINYQFGTDINSASDYDPAAEEASVTYPGESLAM